MLARVLAGAFASSFEETSPDCAFAGQELDHLLNKITQGRNAYLKIVITRVLQLLPEAVTVPYRVDKGIGTGTSFTTIFYI